MNQLPATAAATAGRLRRLHGVLAVAVVVLGLVAGLGKLLCTVGISFDGLVFIEYARDLGDEDPAGCFRRPYTNHGPFLRALLDEGARFVPGIAVMEHYDQHPGYPLALLASKRLLGLLPADDEFRAWIVAGQFVGALAWLLLAAGCLLLGRELLGSAAALAGTFCLAVSPFVVNLHCDVLSDTPALACFVFSSFFAVRLLRAGRSLDAIACGIWGGCGYLFRPEALQAVFWTSLLLAGLVYQRQSHAGKHLILLTLTAALFCCPYMLIRGQVLTKSMTTFTLQEGYCPTMARQLEILEFLEDGPWPIRLFKGLVYFWVGWARGVGRLVLIFVLVGLFAQRRQFWNDPGRRLLALIAASNLLLLPALLYARKGYLDARHVLPVAALTVFWVWPGLLCACGELLGRLRGLPALRRPWLPAALGTALLLLIAWQRVPALLTPLHAERQGALDAAAWLKQHLDQDELILDPDGVISFHAALQKRNCWWHYDPPGSAEAIGELLARHPRAGWLVLPEPFISSDLVEQWSQGLPGVRLAPARSFRIGTAASGVPCHISIYHIEKEEL